MGSADWTELRQGAGPGVSPGLVLSGFQGIWSEGLFRCPEPRAKTPLRPDVILS